MILAHVEVTLPRVTNDGTPAEPQHEAFRDALIAAGFTGWTEIRARGYWRGAPEPVRVFTFYAAAGSTEILAGLARAAMPDQSAIQVVHRGLVSLREA